MTDDARREVEPTEEVGDDERDDHPERHDEVLFHNAERAAAKRAGGRARLLLEQTLRVRRVLDVLSNAPRAGVEGHLLGPEEDTHRGVIGAHDHALGDKPPGDRVLVAVEGDTEHLGDARALNVVGGERRIRQRIEQALLFVLEDERGHLAGLLVDSPVGEVVAPGGGPGR